jgi:hypothetical protein
MYISTGISTTCYTSTSLIISTGISLIIRIYSGT